MEKAIIEAYEVNLTQANSTLCMQFPLKENHGVVEEKNKLKMFYMSSQENGGS